jgi:hypothetical protein
MPTCFNVWQALKYQKPAQGRLPARRKKRGKSLLKYGKEGRLFYNNQDTR